ncbi:hypothetical protein TPE_0450 [Treponema pedis str. T A4]|uniref:Uncharacterized protein n=1 Tax=Treponema pedis str. T A4 TaxID=1291379 RepID=S6A2T3_9SPIR|nr:hypothetical protein TPE_0450 [Treponema pedis str. T A4]
MSKAFYIIPSGKPRRIPARVPSVPPAVYIVPKVRGGNFVSQIGNFFI